MRKVFKLLGITILIFCFSASLSAQIQRPTRPFNIEVGINFGSTLGYSITESDYTDSWSTFFYEVTESGEIAPELSTPMLFGGNVSLITRMGIGVQFALDYNFNSDISGTSSYTGAGYDIGIGDFNYNTNWGISGTVKLMVLSLNVLYKYQGSGMFNPWFAAGGSYYTGSVEASTVAGFGLDISSWFNYVGVYEDASEDLSGIGFNVGAGADIQFNPRIAFTVEARYFIFKKYEMYWMTDSSGTLDVYGYYVGSNISFSSSDVDFINDYMDDLIEMFEFNPSYLKLAVGVKFTF